MILTAEPLTSEGFASFGDVIEVDVAGRRIHLDIADDELARRLENWTPPQPHMDGGYYKLYCDTVLQADEGADLDFLVGCRGSEVKRDSH